MAPSTDRKKVQKPPLYSGLAAAGVLIVSAFLPWISLGNGIIQLNVAGTAGDGWLTLGAGVVGGVILVIVLSSPAAVGALSVPLVAGVGALAIGLYDLSNVTDQAGSSSVGIGLVLTLLASAALAIASVVGMATTRA